MSKAEKLAKQFLSLGIDDLREFQHILENQGYLVGLTIVPDSWLREHGVKSAQHCVEPTIESGGISPVNSNQSESDSPT